MTRPVERIVSGGQTGVDRAALDVAIEFGIPCGGWCPKGRRAEDGRIDPRYPLRETPHRRYAERTEWNVRDSDCTLIIAPKPLKGGTALTRRLAKRYGRPWLVVEPGSSDAADEILAWLDSCAIGALNVAGPRESQQPGIYDASRALLRRIMTANT